MSKSVNDEELRQVAAIYARAGEDGVSPLKAVVEVTGLSRATASRRLSTARRLGYLSSIGQGKAGQVNLRALRVANALGVPYRHLIQAVREHANGDLRIPLED